MESVPVARCQMSPGWRTSRSVSVCASRGTVCTVRMSRAPSRRPAPTGSPRAYRRRCGPTLARRDRRGVRCARCSCRTQRVVAPGKREPHPGKGRWATLPGLLRDGHGRSLAVEPRARFRCRCRDRLSDRTLRSVRRGSCRRGGLRGYDSIASRAYRRQRLPERSCAVRSGRHRLPGFHPTGGGWRSRTVGHPLDLGPGLPLHPDRPDRRATGLRGSDGRPAPSDQRI